jgi:hypothetical protein
MLKTIALIAGLAILLWSLGLPSLRFATAANLTSISDTVTDSSPSAAADHEIDFTIPSALEGGESDQIVLTFGDPADFDLSTIGQEDIDLQDDTVNIAAGNWTVGTTSNTITITLTSGTIATSSVVTILIGNNATDGSPNSQIGNPSAEGSYELTISSGGVDSGSTQLAIIDSVVITASVDTIFTFAVGGVAGGTTINGDTTTGTTSTTSIPFGKLVGGSATTTAQRLTVNTNASNGYVITVQTDGPLESTTGGVIDGFANGGDIDTPVTWASSPVGADVNDATTWGHWGFTTDDATTTRGAGDEFDSQEYAAASTSPRVVMSHDGPTNGTGTGVGTTLVGYKVEISNLQEAGDDYSTTLTYIATPTF